MGLGCAADQTGLKWASATGDKKRGLWPWPAIAGLAILLLVRRTKDMDEIVGQHARKLPQAINYQFS